LEFQLNQPKAHTLRLIESEELDMRFRSVLLSVSACLALAVAANAAPVSYNTVGDFKVGGVSVGSTLNAGPGITLTYVGATGTDVEPESNIALGTFVLNSTTGAAPANLDGATFDLRIVQTDPVEAVIGSDIIMGVLTGTVRYNQSNGKVTFEGASATPPDVVYPSAVYRLVNADFGEKWAVALVAPATGSIGAGVSTIQGRVIGGQGAPVTGIPEPSSYALLGSGLVGLVMMLRRRSSATL